MDRGGDVFGALGWGLRRYAWLVVLTTVLVGVLVPFAISQSPDVYEAKATVAPQSEVRFPSPDQQPRTGEDVFNNGAVADAIRERFGLPDEDPILPERVDLVAGQDTLVYVVIGRADDAQDAADLANTAASTFVTELNQMSEASASFFPQEGATAPATAEPKLIGGPLTIVIGLLAGLILGIGLVGLLLVLRRPVLDPEAAADATGASVLGRVTLPRGRGRVRERDTRGLGPLSRRLLAGGSPVLLVVSPHSASTQRHRLAAVMASVLGRSRNVFACRGGEEDLPTQWELAARRGGRTVAPAPGADDTDLVLVDGPTIEERTHRPDSAVTLLMVPEGIGLGALRQAADEYLDGEPGGVVLVRTRRAGRSPREVRRDESSSGEDEGPGIFQAQA